MQKLKLQLEKLRGNNDVHLPMDYLKLNLVDLGLTLVEGADVALLCTGGRAAAVVNPQDLVPVAFCHPPTLEDDYCGFISECRRHAGRRTVVESFEGEDVTLYHFRGEWRLCSNRDPDDKAYMGLFRECADPQTLSPGLTYHYTLVHHRLQKLVDYAPRFGRPDYARAVLLVTRDAASGAVTSVGDGYPSFPDLSVLDEMNSREEKVYHCRKVKDYGVRVYFVDGEYDAVAVLHTVNVRHYKDLCLPSLPPGSSLQYVHLYQSNNLDEYMARFKEEAFFRTVEGSYQVKSLLDTVFKTLTSDVFFAARSPHGNFPSADKGLQQLVASVQRQENATLKHIYDRLKSLDPLTFCSFVSERARACRSKSSAKTLVPLGGGVPRQSCVDVAQDFILSKVR